MTAASILRRFTHARHRDFGFWILVALALSPSVLSLHGITRSVAMEMLLMALLGRRRLVVAAMLPALLVLPMALYYVHLTGHLPGVQLWLVLFYCSVPVIMGYLHTFAPWLLAWAVVCLGGVGVYLSRPRGPVLPGGWGRHGWLRWFTLLLALPMGARVMQFNREDFHRAVNYNPFYGMEDYYDHSYPWDLATGYMAGRHETRRVTDMARRMNHQPVRFAAPPESDPPHVVVLVIGESARRDHMHLYGYGVADTPEMEREDGLLRFGDMVTPFDYTVGAVPVILSQYDRVLTSRITEHDLISVFNAAGYDTWWISNHPRLGPYDSVIGAYSEQARHIIYTTASGGMMSRPQLDEVLLPHVADAIRGARGNTFIVVHVFGSHEYVGDRYPRSFAHFGSEYDNSIAYGDHILAQVTDMVRAAPGENMLFSVADHGVRVDECTPGHPQHGDLKQSYAVPFLMWLSPQWIARHPAQYDTVRAHLDAPLMTWNLPDSITEAAGLHLADADATKSVFSPLLARPRRMVHGDGGNLNVDYDHSHNTAQCHIMPD
ncbi:phosphoethanolamine transferase [Novacetimonas pomaceti]|uniref:phosphoethanolamine transferase n=1 Tax=Novacetimonas pomaceti TaxID=2021998 RepID=UPI001C2D38C4|nr:phosphoethanolamine transferase [Novacetimonas pomaceti]MBV1835163.1 phosphoethanolamine transferase [Novacetimonas pomaceti]